MFDQPEPAVRLGDGWDLGGQIDRNCFSYLPPTDSTVPEGSWGKYTLQWSDSTNLSLRLSVATAFGLGGAVASAQNGSIAFYGIAIRRIVNPGPTAGTCGNVVGGVPRLPAIVALIGADSLLFNLSQNFNAQASAELTSGQVSGNVSVGAASSRGVTASFRGRRWVGGHFLGLTLDPRRDTVRTDYFQARTQLPWDFDLAVSRLQAGRYRVVATRTVPPGTVDTATVDENQPFFFGIPKNGILVGEFFLGRVNGDASGQSVRVFAEKRGYILSTFQRGADRDSMQHWLHRAQ
jgi:hypothetical protein